MKLDFDSGSDESLSSCTSANSSCCSIPVARSDDETHSQKPEEAGGVPTPEEMNAVRQQIKTYKMEMMELMMAEAESKATQMEEQYQQRMRELGQKRQGVVFPPFTHLRGTHPQDVAKQPETFV